MSPRRSPFQHHLIALLSYGVLGLILTYPLVTRFFTHVPGDGIDDPALAWNLWWIKHSLVDQQINPFQSQWMFFPVGINLAFYTLTILNGLLSVPLQTSLSVTAGSNLLLLSSLVLSGYGAYLLALETLRPKVQPVPEADNENLSHPLQEQVARQPDRGSSAHLPATVLIAAFLAGLFFAFSSSKMFYISLGQFNIASSQWIPFAVLYVIRSGRPRSTWRDPLLAALFLLFQAYAELIFATFIVIFIALFAAYRLLEYLMAKRKGRMVGQNIDPSQAVKLLIRNLVIIAVVFLIGLIPFLANMLPDMMAEGDIFVEGGGFADIYSADMAGYALPTQLHPVFGNVIRRLANDSQMQADGRQWQVNKGQHLTLGYLGLLFVLFGLWRGLRDPDYRRSGWPMAAFWGLSTLSFFLLTLGPFLRITGYVTPLPGPFQILELLPFFKGNRYPSRYSVMVLVSASPLLAIGAHWLLTRLSGAGRGFHSQRRLVLVASLLALLLVFENLSTPLPMTDLSVPSIYGKIAAGSQGGSVLDLPAGWRNGSNVFGKQDVIIMREQWWQTEHGQPILGGNTSRNPEHKFRYFLEAPLIGPLTVLANADEEHPHIRKQLENGLKALQEGDSSLGGNALLLQAASDAAGTLEFLGSDYVVVHEDHVPAEFTTFVESYLPITELDREGPHRLYQVQPTEPLPAITLAPAETPLSRAEGWSGVPQLAVAPGGLAEQGLWAHRSATRLLLPPLSEKDHQLVVRARSAGSGQTLSLSVNGFDTDTRDLHSNWQELRFSIPAGVLGQKTNEVVLNFGKTFPIAETDAFETLAVDDGPPAALLVESAGLEAGNYAHIWLNGKDISPNQRGYNLAMVDGKTGQFKSAASFDTHGDPQASDRLVDFLDQFDDGSILLVAVKDTAADQLSERAVEALTELGLSDLGGKLRWSQAAIVIGEGLSPHLTRTFERVDGLQSTSVGWGPGWREPNVAAIVDWIEISAIER
ncbi:MAG: interleukin-like EMT inducer domain-containing protein [Chloroflexota bacterium]|nr:interleukin-like EMT inducer domain-containing protein [Chloroflexota bacterium]